MNWIISLRFWRFATINSLTCYVKNAAKGYRANRNANGCASGFNVHATR